MPKPIVPLVRSSASAAASWQGIAGASTGARISGARSRAPLIGPAGDAGLSYSLTGSGGPMRAAAALTGGPPSGANPPPTVPPRVSSLGIMQRLQGVGAVRRHALLPADFVATRVRLTGPSLADRVTMQRIGGGGAVVQSADDSYKTAASKILDELRDSCHNQNLGRDLLDNGVVGGSRFSDDVVPEHSGVNIRLYGANVPTSASLVDRDTIVAQVPLPEGRNPHSLPALYATVMDHCVGSIVNLTSDSTFKGMFNPAEGDGAGGLGVSSMATLSLLSGAGVSADPAALRAQYWPNEGEAASYKLGNRSIKVKTRRVEQHAGYQIVTLTVKEPAARQVQELKLYHFTQWPDAGVPTDQSLKQFTKFAQDWADNKSSTTLVQCVNGNGRSGAFVVHSKLMAGIRAGVINRTNLLMSIRKLLVDGTLARGRPFVRYTSEVNMLIGCGQSELDRLEGRSTSGASAQAGAAASQPGITERPPNLGGILHALRANQLTTVDKRQTTVNSQQWRHMISRLTSAELYQLGVDEAAPLGENSGYPTDLRGPVIEAYVALRVPELVQETGSVQQALNKLEGHRNPAFRTSTLAGNTMRAALGRYGRQSPILQQKALFVRRSSS